MFTHMALKTKRRMKKEQRKDPKKFLLPLTLRLLLGAAAKRNELYPFMQF